MKKKNSGGTPATSPTPPTPAAPAPVAPAATPTAAPAPRRRKKTPPPRWSLLRQRVTAGWIRLRPYSGVAMLLLGVALATTVWWLARPAQEAQVPPDLVERVARLEKAATQAPAPARPAPARPAPTRPAPAPARPAPAPTQPAPAQPAQPPAEAALVAEQQRVAALQEQVVALQQEIVALATQQLQAQAQQQVAQQQQPAQVQATGFASLSASAHEGLLVVRAEGGFPTGTSWGVLLNGSLSPHGFVPWDNRGNQKTLDAPRGAVQIQVRVKFPDGGVVDGPTIHR